MKYCSTGVGDPPEVSEREALGALAVARVEGVDAQREAARVAADVVERQQPGVAVERSVLDALGHHGRGRLLKACDERIPAGRLERQDPGQRRGQAGLGDRLPIRLVHLVRPRLDVGPVDRERGQRALEATDRARRLAP
jgi:hypothetical protein